MALMLSGLLTGCGTASSERRSLALPPLVDYSTDDQRRAADELASIRSSAPTVARMVDDYGNLRAAIRAGARQD